MKAPSSVKRGQFVNNTSKKIANSTITVAVKMLQGTFLPAHKQNLRPRSLYAGEIRKERSIKCFPCILRQACWICDPGKLGQGNNIIIVSPSFSNEDPLIKCFPSPRKKAGVFKFLQLEDN